MRINYAINSPYQRVLIYENQDNLAYAFIPISRDSISLWHITCHFHSTVTVAYNYVTLLDETYGQQHDNDEIFYA